ncbi:MAG TPA: hypothetical protein VK203_28455 [Nostocaceae cyanobacterium]|nr:hypothetical protein [Nostocaceae cyanobacterium]
MTTADLWLGNSWIALPCKNENVLKSVTIDGTLCKRLNCGDRLVSFQNSASDRLNSSRLRIFINKRTIISNFLAAAHPDNKI